MQGTHATVCSQTRISPAENAGWKNKAHHFIKRWRVLYCSWTQTLSTIHTQTTHERRAESQTQNAVFRPRAIILQEFLLSTTVADVFNVLHQCSVLFRINELHLPTSQKPIKTDKTPTLQTHYAKETHPIPSVLPSLELTFSPLGTSLPPLWVSAFMGKLCLTSHTLWSVGV